MRPVLRTLGDGRIAAWPIDPAGGGTWVAAGSHGLAMAAMNLNPSPAPKLPPADTLISRGMLIPSMIDADDAPRAIARLATIDPERYAPFRIIAADANTVIEATWDRKDLTVRQRVLGAVCFVSSGLGDHLVTPRLDLFDAWLAEHGTSAVAQDSFHRHRWSDRPEISVNMSRDDARTVSTTSIDVVEGHTVVMNYRDDDGPYRLDITPIPGGSMNEARTCVGASNRVPPC